MNVRDPLIYPGTEIEGIVDCHRDRRVEIYSVNLQDIYKVKDVNFDLREK